MLKKKLLGQFMTPELIASLVAQHIPSTAHTVIDLAAGDCSLLRSAHERNKKLRLLGYEIDPIMHKRAQGKFPAARISRTNGLLARLPAGIRARDGLTLIGNPPFSEITPTEQLKALLEKAFPSVTTKLGNKRAELYFLARSLLLAKPSSSTVAILMPIGFADGDIYRQYRADLIRNYHLRRVIEIPANSFTATEARTVLLVIDTAVTNRRETEICSFDGDTNNINRIYKGAIVPGERLDARYHSGRIWFDPRVPKLQDLGVTIIRGNYSHKEAKALKINAVHTSDLARARSGMLSLGGQFDLESRDVSNSNAIATTGDILLSRTGSRVHWTPVIVSSGSAPITDHVFRIRVPKKSEALVRSAFMHPSFSTWLQCMTKGVCATVLTKRELLTMPMFSALGKSQ